MGSATRRLPDFAQLDNRGRLSPREMAGRLALPNISPFFLLFPQEPSLLHSFCTKNRKFAVA